MKKHSTSKTPLSLFARILRGLDWGALRNDLRKIGASVCVSGVTAALLGSNVSLGFKTAFSGVVLGRIGAIKRNKRR